MTIEFNENNFGANQFTNIGSSGSAMVDFLIKKGVVKDSAAANSLLVIFALCCIALSIYFFVFGFSLPEFGGTQPTSPSVPIIQEETSAEFDF